eukprot:TRINITY_DN3431_c0_g1_i3.p1 TRINITY_DN3431_c0_g1~~TRINITY_DN3431_c0_g1_i3.p1  ORF type:complete len:276 (+),score=51.50 TRINITY_DN3431_c0_g1_i3:487-1314(+)
METKEKIAVSEVMATVLYQKSGHIATITLNRPDIRNALSEELRDALVKSLNIARDDQEVLVVILTGKDHFCAGAFLTDSTNRSSGTQVFRSLTDPSVPKSFGSVLDAMVTFPKPIIGAIPGAAAGAGFSLAMACDFKVMSEDAYGLLAFVNIGLVPDVGASYYLVKNAGYTRALEMAMMGEKIPAQKCLEWGLVNRVVPKSKLLEEANKIAQVLLTKPPVTLSRIKKTMQYAATHDLGESVVYEALNQAQAIEHEEAREGVTAFREKRKPNWSKL